MQLEEFDGGFDVGEVALVGLQPDVVGGGVAGEDGVIQLAEGGAV